MSGLKIDLHRYDSEEVLLDGLRTGDPDACTCMVKRFAPLVYARVLRMLNDPDEAETILQQTFIKACDKIRQFEGRSGLGTWIYRIATNEALMKLRRRSPAAASIDELADSFQVSDMPGNLHTWTLDPAHAILDTELRDQMDRALQSLPESLRVIFVLREMQSLSTLETAELLGIGESAVKVRLHRARLRLRELLSDYLGTESETNERPSSH